MYKSSEDLEFGMLHALRGVHWALSVYRDVRDCWRELDTICV